MNCTAQNLTFQYRNEIELTIYTFALPGTQHTTPMPRDCFFEYAEKEN